ncbi:MAG: FGGY family carbohydrate kinase [Bacillota bacterium]|nr:FGGY family carbohydrate kinase [Bacillota bacterium]
MFEEYILAIDMGTTAFKAAVFDYKGNELGCGVQEYTLLTPEPGWAEMKVETYIETFKKVIDLAIEDTARNRREGETPITLADILTVGFSCQCETTVFLDGDGLPLRDAIVWLDTRASKEAKAIVDEFGSNTVQRHTGQVGEDAIWPGAKLLWLKEHEPEIFERTEKILQLNSYFTYLLTGKFISEDSMLGSSIYWDINTRKYWPEMLDYIGIGLDQLPEIRRPGDYAGNVSVEAAARFGFSTYTAVSIGGTDLACGAIGSGNIKPGDFSESTGSSLCTMTMTDRVVLDPNKQMPCYCSGLPNMYMVHAYSNGGLFLKWFRDTFCENELSMEADGGMNAYDQLDALAAAVPPGAEGLRALPHLQGSGPPMLNPNARGTFSGMTLAHSKKHFARAIMESVAMSLTCIIEATERIGLKVHRIKSLGGGALSPIWCQIKADATGKEISITRNNESACCLGAALLAGVCAGAWPDMETACRETISEDRVYIPNGAHRDIYDGILEDYKNLMECMEPMFK